jgi:prevent-host-death family protein
LLDADDDVVVTAMKEMPFAEFRKDISKTLERVRRTRLPILVTKSHAPLAVIKPVSETKPLKRRPRSTHA